jgi:oxaloacetate decarboxylase alpha subunit
MFPKVAPDFFKKRGDGPVVFKPEAEAPATKAAAGGAAGALIQPGNYSINVNGANYTIAISSIGGAAPATSSPAAAASSGATSSVNVPAPVAGTVLRYAVSEGAEVQSGTTILIIESMKMELEIKSTAAGKVHFLVPAGTQVAAQQPIAQISGAAAAPAGGGSSSGGASGGGGATGGGVTVPAPVAGTILRYAVNEGDQVASGATIIIIESMKMELEIKSTAAGRVHFLVSAGTQVAAQQPIAELK